MVANLQRNIVIPVPGSAPPIKRPSVNPNPNPNPNPNSNPTSSFLVSSNPVVQDLFSCSWDKTIKKWNAQNFNLKEQIGGYFSDEVSDFVFLYNTKINCWTMIATGGGLDHSLVFWEMPKTL